MAVSDKVAHFLVSFAVTLVFYAMFAVTTAAGLRRRLQFSALCSFLIGLIKECGDGWLWNWPWCPCSADWRDLVANVLGIFMSLLAVVQIRFIYATVVSKSSSQVEQNVSSGLEEEP
jgi:hypothetical protein